MTKKIRVLYVDDEPALLELGKLFLEESGEFSVSTIDSASAALNLLEKQRFDAIISDYQMSEMDGIQFLIEVRSRFGLIPFILFTGKGREEVVIQAINNGADYYLQKGGEPTAQFAELSHKITTAVGHRQDEMQVVTLKKLYNVLSATNKAIVHIRDKKELLNEICRIAVNIGGFMMAWAGFLNPDNHVIEPSAGYGHIEGYLDSIVITTSNNPSEISPTGTAFRKRSFNVCNDISGVSKLIPWRNAALERGYRSLAAFPFALDTKNAGVITFYAAEPGFFTDQIIKLLNEQSSDISFAFVNLDNEEERISSGIELKDSELQYRRLFETAQDAILILNWETGEIIDANKFILDMLGYPLSYFIGKHLWELGFIRDKSISENAFNELKTNGYIRYENIPLETNDGRSINVEFISNVYMVTHHKIIQCNIRDNTASKRAEDALALTGRKLELLASITRHDINNQLLVLNSFLELLQMRVEDPALEDYFTRITNASDRISSMIQFTKIYEQIGVNEPVWQNCRALIEIAANEVTFGQVNVENVIPSGAEVFADPLIVKVFYNLMDNAIRHGGKITTIRFAVEEREGEYIIVCEDDGVGVPFDEKEKIFERGFGKNTGHGLTISREILSITGIKITETGEPKKGVRFEIKVPNQKWRFPGEKS